MNAIIVFTAASALVTVPMIATINWQMTIPNAPQMSRGRRPTFSILQNEIGVEKTLTRVVMSEIKNGF